MRIGVLGSGVVGRTLAAGLHGKGHDVMIGSRDPGKLSEWAAAEGAGVATGTFAETAAHGEVVMLATLWSGTESALDLAGADALDGKVLIDVTNPLAYGDAPPPGLALGFDDSGGEQVQRWVPGARVVKTLNIVGAGSMIDPDFPDGPPDMFLCGDDDGAKATVTSLLEQLGWPVTDIGGLEGARLMEPLAILWVVYGFRSGGWNHAFKLLRR
jgi:predicted dinucleotide-binding enzyme